MKCEFGARKKRQNNETIFGCGASNIETVSPEKENNQSRLPKKKHTLPQCGKFGIFLLLRFYVKSILENVIF